MFNLHSEENCSLPDFPIETYGAVAGRIRGQEVVCGGSLTDQCFNILSGEDTSIRLVKSRRYASSVTTDDKLFIFGGYAALDSYEVISEEDHIQKSMPFEWSFACSVLINDTTILLIGGPPPGHSESWYFHFEADEWIQGPKMNQERYKHGCGFFKALKSVAVFGGVPYTDTAEILPIDERQFSYSKN